MSERKQKAFRLSGDAQRLLAAIAQRLGLTETGALEIIIREAAEKRGIALPPAQQPPQP